MPALIRRCKMLFLEPCQQTAFALADVLAGGSGVVASMVWRAYAPHLDEPVDLSEEMVLLLGTLEPERWQLAPCAEGAPALAAILAAGLAFLDVDREDERFERDQVLRELHWWPAAATLHWLARWQGKDSVEMLRSVRMETAQGLRDRLGVPPAEGALVVSGMRALPHHVPDAFDVQLQSRSTCRNYDAARALPLDVVAKILHRTLGEQGHFELDPQTRFLKKNVPSAGGLHPTEAFLLVQNVSGLDDGIYRYDAVRHGLIDVESSTCMRSVARLFTAGQHWFADAHVLVVLAPRFARTYWKYRNHSKAYRAVLLDVGHISQLLITCASEQGLGAFVTSAINERDIEAALGMEPMQQSPIAVCGFGWRAERMVTAEFDPAGAIWRAADTATVPLVG